jgi:pimeloyl-ACP methyl ester carboxylesterase
MAIERIDSHGVPPATRNHVVVSGAVSLAVTTAGDATNPPIVLVHGYPDTKDMWRPVIERLAADFHVIAYDVRGAGGSSAPRGPAPYDLSLLADDFDRVCAELAPGRAVHLVGHDWGGIQGWEFVTAPRFAGRIASFTTIAGPALGHVLHGTRSVLRRGQVMQWLDRIRRSWYVVVFCLPGGPTIAWRLLLRGGRWRRLMAAADRVPVDDGYPAPTLVDDALHGANLYRRNIPRRLLRPAVLAPSHAPVQIVIPTHDRFISPSYYDAADQVAPGLRRRTIDTSHWAPRTQPALIAEWIAEFARGHEPG